MSSMAEAVIRNEADAYALLEAAVSGKVEALGTIRFEGWPSLRIYVKGPKFQRTITPAMMEGFLELQKSLWRSYAVARYNVPSARVLSKEERQALEIEVEVEGGSSEFTVNFTEFLGKIVELVGGRMSSTELLILTITLALFFGGHSAFRHYLQHRKEMRERELTSEDRKALLEVLNFMGVEETKRHEMLAKIIEQNAKVDNIEREAHDAKTALVKSIGRADPEEAIIQGVDLDPSTARELTKNARSRSEDVRLDGEFRIQKVDASRPGHFKVTLRSIESSLSFDARVQDGVLNSAALQLLREAEWGRRSVKLKVSARQVGDNIIDASVLEVEPI